MSAKPYNNYTNLKKDGFPGERHLILNDTVIRKSRKLPLTRELMPTHIGHFVSASGHFVRRQQPIYEYILMYCVSGMGWCSFRNRRRRLLKDTAVVIPAGEPHSYGTTKLAPWTIYWVHMIGDSLHKYLQALGISNDRPTIDLQHGGDLIHHFEEMYELACRRINDSVLLALSTSLAGFLGTLNLHRVTKDTPRPSSEDNVRATVEFMQRNLSQNLSLQELADHARLSVPQYVSLFRKLLGMPPVRFYLNMKMQKAAELLTDTEMKVREVAAQLGISDPYYFSRLFKKVMGVAPSGYSN